MLLRFEAANCRSLRDAQELSLVASSLSDVEEGLLHGDAFDAQRVLPVIVIYGANASGKSNFISALRDMCRFVVYSHSRGASGEKISVSPFALDEVSGSKPSTFSADFVIDQVRYHYGFSVSSEAFEEEWLYTFPNNRRQTLFKRHRDNFSFGRSLKGRNKIIADLTRANSLFLSAAAQNDHEDLSKISSFFSTLLGNCSPFRGVSTLARKEDSELYERVVGFLQAIGTGIVGIRRKKDEMPEEIQLMRKEIASTLQKTIGEAFNAEEFLKEEIDWSLQLAHSKNDGKQIYFSWSSESDGTRRLLDLLGPIFGALDSGATLVIDELDASLHTQACEAVIALFSSATTNPRGAQLITTTHDTNLLQCSMLRRDQIWFAEKDADGATHVYPLTDIRTRKGDNIEKGYLQGRYGAIPFAGSIADIVTRG